MDGGRTLCYLLLTLALLHADNHTIYEDNRQARHALLEHSLMDVHGARGEELEQEGGRRVWKTKNEVWVAYSFHYCKLNYSSRETFTCFFVLHVNELFCVARQIFQRVCGLILCQK